MDDKELEQLINKLNSNKAFQPNESNHVDELYLNELERELMIVFQPERALIVYGTLAPNRPNHSVVEHIKGTWHKGKVKGKLVNQGWGAQSGYNGFMHASLEEQTEIEVFVLISEELVSNWQYLDDFEGEDYIRILASYELDTGEKGVGNIYAINQNSH